MKKLAEDTIESLTVKTIDGIAQSSGTLTVESASHPVVDGEKVTNKLELTLNGTQLQVGKNYVIELAKETVEDNYGNTNDKVLISVLTVQLHAEAEAGAVITTEISEPENNVIKIVFANTDEKGMTDSVLNPSNYTIGNKTLPAGTDIKFVDNKNKVRITLPEAFVNSEWSIYFCCF